MCVQTITVGEMKIKVNISNSFFKLQIIKLFIYMICLSYNYFFIIITCNLIITSNNNEKIIVWNLTEKYWVILQ